MIPVSTFPARPIRSASGAFSLIELLVVVAIISILAAIAIPNLLQAQTRSKVSRVKTDMRSLATAIESYNVDYNSPPVRHNSNEASKPQVPKAGERLAQMAALTTPIGYITNLFPDVFESRLKPPNNLIDYYDPMQTSWLINSRFPSPSDQRRVSVEEARWILVSVGPDGYLGAVQPGLHGWPTPNDPNLTTLGTIYVIYDPTNGSVSSGNIYGGARGVGGTPDYLLGAFRF